MTSTLNMFVMVLLAPVLVFIAIILVEMAEEGVQLFPTKRLPPTNDKSDEKKPVKSDTKKNLWNVSPFFNHRQAP
jgi:hypothetical protein